MTLQHVSKRPADAAHSLMRSVQSMPLYYQSEPIQDQFCATCYDVVNPHRPEARFAATAGRIVSSAANERVWSFCEIGMTVVFNRHRGRLLSMRYPTTLQRFVED
jgi:hypothetical protein